VPAVNSRAEHTDDLAGVVRCVDAVATWLHSRRPVRGVPLVEQLRHAAAAGDELARQILARGVCDAAGARETKA
jgi:hypothetical protein